MADQRTLTDRARSALIREWAEENGFDVSKSGRIPRGVVTAWEAAQGGSPPPAEDGPDWEAAASAAGEDPLAALEQDLAAEDQAAAGQDAGGGTSPPPPASLEEARARFSGKPKRPSWASSRDAKPKTAAPKVTRAVVGDMEGKLTLLLMPPILFWQATDPLCGGAAAENLDNLVKKAVPLLCQSPSVVAWFAKSTTFMLWLEFVWACEPVARAVWSHHVAANVMVVDGRVVPAKRLEDGRVVPADQAPPPQRVDNSAYSTVTGHVPEPRAV